MVAIRGSRSVQRWMHKSAPDLTEEELRQCYVLVRRIKWLYIAAGQPWAPKEKMSEMRDTEGLEYDLIVGPKGCVEAFVSYVTDDIDDHGVPTTFIYEIHVTPQIQGKGIGRKLLENVRARTHHGMTLRVFTRNKKAIYLYEKMGFGKDEALCDDNVWYMRRSPAA